MKYSYSHNGEEFQGMCDSIEDAISEACDDDDMAEVIYVGEAHQKTIGEYLWSSDVERLLEQLSEQASEECGECASDWLHGPYFESYIKGETPEERKARTDEFRRKQQDRLRPLMQDIMAALEKWATENDEQPGFWHVSNVKKYDREGNRLAESI